MKIPEWVRVERASQMNAPIQRLRFAVGGENSPKSSVWTAWSTEKGDYYIGVETLTGSIKASFHPDGNCHYKIKEAYWKTLRDRGLLVPREPKIVAWRRAAIPDEGAIHVASVLFPHDLMTIDTDSASERRDGWWSDSIYYFAPASVGEAVEVGFFFSKRPGAEIENTLRCIGYPFMYSDIRTESGWAMTANVVIRTCPFDSSSIRKETTIGEQSIYDKAAIGRDLSAVLCNVPDEYTALQLVQVSSLRVHKNALPK